MPATYKVRLTCATSLVAAFACMAPAARAATTATVPGNVAGWVATAAQTGTADDSRSVTIAVHMALKNSPALAAFVERVAKPGTTQYGHYLSRASFQHYFAPDAADVAAVRAFLTKAGLANVTVGPANAYVSADATVGQLRSTFAISQNMYRFGARELRSNKEAPSIPAALAGKVLFIEGLDDTTYLKQPMHHSVIMGDALAPKGFVTNAAVNAITPPPVAANLPSPYCNTYWGQLRASLSTQPAPYARMLPWLMCGYTPQQIQAAYGMDKVTPNGTGIKIAIVDAYASPTIKDDANRYAANHNLPPLVHGSNFFQDVPKGIYHVSPTEACGPYGWWGEESLDVAAVHGSAPGATIIYNGGRDCGTSLTLALLNVIYTHQADIITNSYGFNGEADSPADVQMQDQGFMSAAAQGITVLFSSGDGGDLSQLNGVATGAFSATSPYVTGVGGTTLALTNASGAKKEWGWGTYRDYLNSAMVVSGTAITTSGLATTTAFGATFDAFTFYAGAGGGISLIEAQPSYQASVVPATLATQLNTGNGQTITLSHPQRVSPDISMLADPYTGYLIGESFTAAGNPVSDAGCTAITGGATEYCEIPYGGTSLASPLMAGMIAVVDQAHLAAGRPLVGFANPWLYGAAIGTGTLQAAGVNDIVAPAIPEALLRGYANDLTRVRVVTVNSVPYLIDTAPFALQVCASTTICQGVNDVFNYVTPAYDDVTGLGVPYAPKLVTQ